MLKRIRRAMEEKDQGFTLIELLVVMIIIGILAAIAVPVFLSQRSKAQDTAAKSDVGILGKEIATYWVDGTYPPKIAMASGRYTLAAGTSTTTWGTAADIGKTSANNTLVSTFTATPTAATTAPYLLQTATTWCIAVMNTSSGNTFKYSAQNGLETGNCSSATAP